MVYSIHVSNPHTQDIMINILVHPGHEYANHVISEIFSIS